MRSTMVIAAVHREIRMEDRVEVNLMKDGGKTRRDEVVRVRSLARRCSAALKPYGGTRDITIHSSLELS